MKMKKKIYQNESNSVNIIVTIVVLDFHFQIHTSVSCAFYDQITVT